MLRFIIGFIFLIAGLMFMIFNVRLGIFFFNNKVLDETLLNSRQHVVVFGLILAVLGLGSLFEQFCN